MGLKPGYKQTDVGVIPEDWEVLRLADLLDQPRSVRYGVVQPGKFDPRGVSDAPQPGLFQRLGRAG